MPSIADCVRQLSRGETPAHPVKAVWTVHDGGHGVLWTIVEQDGQIFEQRHYPNIATPGGTPTPSPARLIGTAPEEEVQRFARTLIAQGFDWIQLPLLPVSKTKLSAHQQVELTVTAGEQRFHFRCPAIALELTPRLREIGKAFERLVSKAMENPPMTTERPSTSPLREVIELWRAKKISGATLLRHLVSYESWYVPIPADAAEEVSTQGAPSRVTTNRDAQGVRRLLLYSDPASCAQFRWAPESGGTEQQHYLAAAGGWVFRLPLDKVDELVIDPGAGHEITYKREQLSRFREMADALEMEAMLARLPAHPEEMEELLPMLWNYSGYSIAMHNRVGRPPQVALTRDDQGRTLAAIFTFDDAFSAFQIEDARGRYADERVVQTPMTGAQLFEVLAGMDVAGVVFNPSGPAAPVVFALEFARIVWNSQRPPPPISSAPSDPPPPSTSQEGLSFDGETYVLQSAASDETVIVNEFLPDGQTRENWSRMLAERLFFQENDPQAYALALETRLKEANPASRPRVSVTDDGQEAIIDFLILAEDRSKTTEFNIFRFLRHPKGLLAYQFAYRPGMIPGGAGEDDLRLRDIWVDLMKEITFPELSAAPAAPKTEA
jgi:hypothetical protein